MKYMQIQDTANGKILSMKLLDELSGYSNIYGGKRLVYISGEDPALRPGVYRGDSWYKQARKRGMTAIENTSSENVQ